MDTLIPWQKKGLIFTSDKQYDWMFSHSQVPIVERIDESRLRIYFGTRNQRNQTVTTFIDVASDEPKNILYVHDQPVLSTGKLGCFDDSGAMPSWVINHSEKKYLYYIGWNVGVTVPYRNSIGLAASVDGGLTFTRLDDGPIMDRTLLDAYMCSTPCVLIEDNCWRMWYLSGVGWQVHEGQPEPYYHIKYAESSDGIVWKREGRVCIDFESPDEGGIARPTVLKDSDKYRMWYSYRGGSDYRTNKVHTYRIGYAESEDGVEWTRKDNQVGIDISDSGWDSEMICYPYVIHINDKTYMFYNGNGFGRSGFGYAILDKKQVNA